MDFKAQPEKETVIGLGPSLISDALTFNRFERYSAAGGAEMRLLGVCVGLLLLAMTSGCAAKLTDLSLVSTRKGVSPGTPGAARVSAEACGPVIFFPCQSHVISLESAVTKALDKAGSQYDALADVDVRYVNKSFFFGVECIRVTGTPIDTRAKTASLGLGRLATREMSLEAQAQFPVTYGDD